MVLLDCPTQAFIMMERSRYERGTDSAHHESAKCLNVEAGRHVEFPISEESGKYVNALFSGSQLVVGVT